MVTESHELERRRGCFILTFIFAEKYIQEILHWKKKKKLSQLKILRQPASADFWVVSTCCFKFIQQKVENLLQKKVERTQKSAEAGCLKILNCLYFFFFTSVDDTDQWRINQWHCKCANKNINPGFKSVQCTIPAISHMTIRIKCP